MRKLIKFLCLCAVFALFCSCSTITKTTQVRVLEQKLIGNEYHNLKGLTENQILRKMSTPDREMSDGEGGKILIYEDIKYVTNSSNTHSSYTSSSAYGSSVAGYNVYGNPQVNRNAYGSSATTNTQNARSVSEEQKKYVNFFINPEGICYDVKANYGNIYETVYKTKYQDCYYHKVSPWGFITWLLPPVGLGFTVYYVMLNGARVGCGDPYEK